MPKMVTRKRNCVQPTKMVENAIGVVPFFSLEGRVVRIHFGNKQNNYKTLTINIGSFFGRFPIF